MGIKGAQNRSTYLSNIEVGGGLEKRYLDNNIMRLSLKLGNGLRLRNGEILELDGFVPAINFEGDSTLYPKILVLYDENNSNEEILDYILTLDEGTIYVNNQGIYIEPVKFKTENSSWPTITNQTKLAKFNHYQSSTIPIPSNAISFLYYNIAENTYIFNSTDSLDIHPDFIPIARLTTLNNGTITEIVDRRPRITVYTSYGTSNIAGNSVGEIRLFPESAEETNSIPSNFIKCDGRIIPSNYIELKRVLNSNFTPVLPVETFNGMNYYYYILARPETNLLVAPTFTFSSREYNKHIDAFDINNSCGILSAFYYNNGNIIELSQEEIDELATQDGLLPISTKLHSSSSSPFLYIFSFNKQIGAISINTYKNNNTYIVGNIRANIIDQSKVIISAIDDYVAYNPLADNPEETSCLFDFIVSYPRPYVAINQYDHYSHKITITDPQINTYQLNFLLEDKNVIVFKNGELLDESKYTLNLNSITFNEQLSVGDTFVIISRTLLPADKHAHLPNYDSGWITSNIPINIENWEITFTHNLFLKEPLYSDYKLIFRFTDSNSNNEYFNANIRIKSLSSTQVTLIVLDNNSIIPNNYTITGYKLIIFSNQPASLIQKSFPQETNINIDGNIECNNMLIRNNLNVTGIATVGLLSAMQSIETTNINVSNTLSTNNLQSNNATIGTANITTLSTNNSSIGNAYVSSLNVLGISSFNNTATFNQININTTGSDQVEITTTSNIPNPTGTKKISINGYLYATKVYNAVWGDIAEFFDISPDDYIFIEFGCAYTIKNGKFTKTDFYGQDAIGIASDTYGIAVGNNSEVRQIPIAIAGKVLAKVDKEYKLGTPLTCTKNGILTKANIFIRLFYPNKILAKYLFPEKREMYGNKIQVNGRHWILVV